VKEALRFAYINADPILAKRLEDVGCATVMPWRHKLWAGLKNAANIQIILENAGVPVVVDAGIGTPSEAAQAMELGADALLINTAIAKKNPAAMARAMSWQKQGVCLPCRTDSSQSASASSPWYHY